MPTESEKRRPTFDLAASHPVVMGDGQTWYLPKPHTRMRPKLAGRKVVATLVVTDDPEFNALVQAIEDEDSYASVVQMAAYLLDRNYDLTDDEMSEVLTYDPADQSPERWTIGVMNTIYGRTGPKP